MIITFPFVVRQVAENKVEVETHPGQILDDDFADRLARWGLSPGEVEEIAHEALEASVKASLKLG